VNHGLSQCRCSCECNDRAQNKFFH
jgi:hypothetical protein